MLALNVIYNALSQYYKIPNFQTATNLLEGISEFSGDYCVFNQSAFDLAKPLSLEHEYEHLTMYTSGTTTGVSRTYHFGPHSAFWVKEIESLLKNPHQRPMVMLREAFLQPSGKYANYKCQIGPHPYALYQYLLLFDFFYIDRLIQLLKQIDQPIISAFPHVFLYLMSHPKFVETAIDYKWSIMTTYWEALFKKHPGIHINDNMIDWMTGCNFFTCEFDRKHFLPIFAQSKILIRNLLNFCYDKVEINDLLQIGEHLGTCQCGRPLYQLRFISHMPKAIQKNNGEYFCDLEISNRLEGLYYNLQFIQDGEIILVLYAPDHMSTHDKHQISQWLFDNQFNNIKFLPNTYLITGGNEKMSSFCRFQAPPIQRWPTRKFYS